MSEDITEVRSEIVDLQGSKDVTGHSSVREGDGHSVLPANHCVGTRKLEDGGSWHITGSGYYLES